MIIRGVLLLVLVVTGALGAPPPAPPPATPVAAETAFERRLREVDAGIGGVADLRAEFEQRKHTPLLREPLVSSGAMIVKGDRVRWETRRPRASSMTIGGGEVRIYYPDAAVVEVYEAEGDLREMSGSPLVRLASLRERFAISEMDPAELGAPEGEARFIGVELTPLREEMLEHVSRVRVVLDAGVPCISIIEMTDPDGERTVIEFKDVRVNSGVKDEELAMRVPEGTRESRPGKGR